jgi:D-alanyl-D-alanine carboxypeptidase
MFVTMIGLLVLSTWPGASRDQFREQVDAYLQSPGAGPYNGVVFVQRPGAPPVEAAYGVADADLSVPLTTSMRFGIGSLTKPITAAAVMRLVEKGRLSKSDRICRFVDPCPASWAPVMLEHLLSHTSGIPDLFTELPAAQVEQTRKIIDEAIARHTAAPLLLAPGERYAYSNFGYFLLGYALESSTGMLWPDVVRQEVLAPAGMTETEYDDVWAILPRRVRGYVRDEDGLRHIRYRDHASYAAGGLLSTLRDLVAFDDALVSGRLISAATLRDMTTPRLADYGLGWQMIRVHGRPQRNHSGGTNGFSSHFARYEDGTRVVVLSNVEGAALAKAVACDLAAIAFGTTPAQRPSVEASCRPS